MSIFESLYGSVTIIEKYKAMVEKLMELVEAKDKHIGMLEEHLALYKQIDANQQRTITHLREQLNNQVQGVGTEVETIETYPVFYPCGCPWRPPSARCLTHGGES